MPAPALVTGAAAFKAYIQWSLLAALMSSCISRMLKSTPATVLKTTIYSALRERVTRRCLPFAKMMVAN